MISLPPQVRRVTASMPRSRQPGAPYDVHEDGLGLVVGGVAQGCGVGPLFGGDPGQERVACLTGGLFQRKPVLLAEGKHVGLLQGEGDVEAAKGLGHESRVCIRCVAAQSVVQVCAMEAQPQAVPQVMEGVEHRQRVGAS